MREKTVYMFPGQGAQSVGMRAKLGDMTGEQRGLFATADRILGFPLTSIIDQGPEEELTRTSNTQPALLAMEIAFSRALHSLGYRADIVMGHSLGEYAALVDAGVIDFEEALRLVRHRGELMEKAVVTTPGKMAAVIGAERARLEDILQMCSGDGIIEITNFNSPVQVVLSGEVAPIDKAIALIHQERVGKALELRVSTPFHSSLMKPVADAFQRYLADIDFKKPQVEFIDNVTGLHEKDPERIKEKLVLQLSHPVQWEKSVNTALQSGATTWIECGPGTILVGLVKRIDPEKTLLSGEKLIHGATK